MAYEELTDTKALYDQIASYPEVEEIKKQILHVSLDAGQHA